MDWYPFYPALYRSHTMHLTAEQDGIYRRLIDYYMESRQPLPDNDFALARIASVDTECFKYASSILRAFFEQSNGLLKHKKCDELLDEQDLKSKFYAKRAKKAASIRHGKTKDLCLKHPTSNSEAMLGDATITDNNKKKVSKNRGTRFALAQCPVEWVEVCKALRPDLQAKEVFDGFRDYWIGVSGSKGIKLDWDATWRNWVRNQKQVGYQKPMVKKQTLSNVVTL